MRQGCNPGGGCQSLAVPSVAKSVTGTFFHITSYGSAAILRRKKVPVTDFAAGLQDSQEKALQVICFRHAGKYGVIARLTAALNNLDEAVCVSGSLA